MATYEARAMEAIHALKARAGVSYPALRKQMLAMYPDANNENALRLALKNGVLRGAFAKEKASYILTVSAKRHMASMDAARKVALPKEEAPQKFETEYERQRAENVSRNQEMLAMLGLASSAQAAPQAKKSAAVGRFQPPPTGERKSARTNSDVQLAAISKARRPKPKRGAGTVAATADHASASMQEAAPAADPAYARSSTDLFPPAASSDAAATGHLSTACPASAWGTAPVATAATAGPVEPPGAHPPADAPLPLSSTCALGPSAQPAAFAPPPAAAAATAAIPPVAHAAVLAHDPTFACAPAAPDVSAP